MSLGDTGEPLARCLYLYENRGIEALAVEARDLYAYENKGIWALSVEARDLYVYENRGIQALPVLARALYAHETARDTEVFPWLTKLDPIEQYAGGTVDLYGDGFGELSEIAAGSTVTTSSVNGSNVGENLNDRTGSEWYSNDGSGGVWVRFTFGTPQTIYAIAIEGTAPHDSTGLGVWGPPVFKFSDGGGDITGSPTVGQSIAGRRDGEILIGGDRRLYVLPVPRTTTYVEIRSGSQTTFPPYGSHFGLAEVWIYADRDQAAETSSAVLNDTLPYAETLGIVSWRNRSPGLWPANGGLPLQPAATVTLPSDAVSGLVLVEEDT